MSQFTKGVEYRVRPNGDKIAILPAARFEQLVDVCRAAAETSEDEFTSSTIAKLRAALAAAEAS